MEEIFMFFSNRNQFNDNIKYVSGVPNVTSNITIKFEPNNNGVDIIRGDNGKILFTIFKEKVKSIEIKKDEKGKKIFLNINNESEFGEEIISFFSDKPNSEQTFTDIKYNLLKFWKLVEENPNAEDDLKTIKEKRDKKTKEQMNGCFIVFGVLLGIFLLFWFFGKSKEETNSDEYNINDSLSTNNYYDNMIEAQKKDSIAVLNQRIISVKNADDEVKNAYLILKSGKYFIDTEILRFKGLSEKFKNTKYKSKLEKTRDSLIKNEEKIAAQSLIEAENEAAKERKKYGEDFRNQLLDSGRDIKVKVYGKNNTTIELTYVLFNDVYFRQFETNGYFEKLHDKGFNKIILTDGFDYNKYAEYE